MEHLQLLGITLALALLMGIGIFWSIGSQNSSSSNNINYTCPNDQYANSQINTTISCSQVNYNQIAGNVKVNYSQIQGFPSGCPSGQAATSITTTLACGTFLTTQTSQYFSYGSCPSNQFATAITTTTLNCASVPNPSPVFQANGSTSSNSVVGTSYVSTQLEFEMSANTYYTFVAYTYVTADTLTGFQFDIPASSVPSSGFLYYACATSNLIPTTNADCATSTGTAFGVVSSTAGLIGSVILHGAITTSPTSSCPCYFQIDFAATVGGKTVTLGAGEYIIAYTSP